MTPERPDNTRASSAVAVLKERGYLRRRPGPGLSAREHVLAWLVLVFGAVLVALAAAIGGALPASLATWCVVSAALLPAVVVAAVAAGVLARGASEWLHRRGRPVVHVAAGSAAAAGLAAAAGWIALVAGPRVPSPGRLVAAGAVLVLAEVCVATGLARWVTASLLRQRLDTPAAGPRLRNVLAATLAASLVLAVAAATLRHGHPPGSHAEPVRVRPSERKLAVLGVDGASRREVLLLGGGPNAIGMERWSWGRLANVSPDAELPVRWITLGTGLSHDRHGVTTLRQLRISGYAGTLLLSPGLRVLLAATWAWTGLVQERTVPAAARSAPTLWEMASRAGVTVGVFGWWGSFPPRRVRGLVASERWLLTGERSPDTLFPVRATGVLPQGRGGTPIEIDRRAAEAVTGGLDQHFGLIMAYFPGWWLEERRSAGPILLEAAALRPHLVLLGNVLSGLRHAGYTVCLIGLRPHRQGWVMWSSGRGAEVRALSPADLVQTCLDALGLPPADGLGGRVRRDLSGLAGPPPPRPMRYGPPPPLAAHASRREGTAQLELLESLGYLH